MVMEASGGFWPPQACKVWNTSARSSAQLTGESHSQKAEEIVQCLSVILQRANAQAVLRRSPTVADTNPSAVTRAYAALQNAETARLAATYGAA